MSSAKRVQEKLTSYDQSNVIAKSSRSSAAVHRITSEGQFNGSHYEISRDGPGAFLSVKLEPNAKLVIYTNPNNVIAKTGDITIQSHFEISLRNVMLLPETMKSTIIGPGEVLLAPPVCGDILPIQLNGDTKWMVGANGFLVTSDDVYHDIETKNALHSFFTRADRFFDVSGNGIVFVNSIGSVIQRQLKQGEQWTVREDHLVACSCRLAEQSKEFSKKIYVFEGPGVLITQSQSARILSKWVKTFQ